MSASIRWQPITEEPLYADARDATKEPPAYLDPETILQARRWLCTEEGWKELKALREGIEDWTPSASLQEREDASGMAQ
jgi:hypothetical protein